MAIPGGDDFFIINGRKNKAFKTEAKKSKSKAGEPSEEKHDIRKKNKIGANGNAMRCFEYHFAGSEDCRVKKKDSGSSSEDAMLSQENDYLLAPGKVKSFTLECRGAAALDSCYTSNVAGESWMKMFLEELDEEALGTMNLLLQVFPT